MTIQEIFAAIFGALGILVGFFIYLAKDRSKIVIAKFASDLIWFVNYILLGAYTGAILNIIAAAREAVFYHRGKRRWASGRVWLFVFIALALISPIYDMISLGSFFSIALLPAVGSAFAVISFYSTDTRLMRLFGYVAYLAWLVYNVGTENISATVSSALVIVSVIVGAAREYISRKKGNADV